MSGETNPAGAMNKRHNHTPIAQKLLISLAERRLIILKINGRLKKGRITAAIIAIR